MLDRRAAQAAGGLRPYLQLMRPANMITAVADVGAGYAVATGAALASAELPSLVGLILATLGLYSGGVVLNDVCDAPIDTAERPERPIPSGRASARQATMLGLSLLAFGFVAASLVSPLSGVIALAIAVLAVLYDAKAKHGPLGPLVMGSCRGLNLLLGMSAVPAVLGDHASLMVLPLAYIAAVTGLSRGEVHGGSRLGGWLSLALLGAVMVAAGTTGISALPFVILLAARVLPPFWSAARQPEPAAIQAAVRAGVLSLIVLDAAIAAGFAGPLYGLALLGLMPLAGWLARRFAVT